MIFSHADFKLQVLCQGGGLRIWTFQSSGHAKCWDILRPRHDHVNVRHMTNNGLIEDAGKSKARDVSKSIHVHFGGIDGCEDAHKQSEANEIPTLMDPKQIAVSFIENIQHHHRSLSMGATPQTFWKDFPCNDELMSCLAYRRMVFERMGSQGGSVPTTDSLATRRRSGL